MAYQTGTAATLDDLLDLLRAFVAANGWTVNYWSGVGGGASAILQIAKGTQYVNLAAYSRSATNFRGVAGSYTDHYLRISGSRGYDAGLAWNLQPGAYTTYTTNTSWLTGPLAAYHFFADADYVHVVVEQIAGAFRHFHFGRAELIGGVLAADYVTGMEPNHAASYCWQETISQHHFPFNSDVSFAGGYFSRLYSDVDTAGWRHFNYAWTALQRAYGINRTLGPWSGLMANPQPNDFNGGQILLPIHLFVERASSLYTHIGTVRDLRYINIQQLQPGQEITLGADTWKVFPWHEKHPWNTNDGLPSSGYYGWAYRKVV